MKKFKTNFPELKEIELCLSSNIWDLGNKTLYDLCSENFDHSTNDKIVAKVWLIGRAYAAAIERRKKSEEDKEAENDMFYEKDVVSTFKNSKIDEYLAKLKLEKDVYWTNLNEILEIHKYLVDEIAKITFLEKRSFCSKYLHFHLPNVFFIYDSRAYYAMQKMNLGKIPSEYVINIGTARDDEYYKFCMKCLYLRDEIKKNFDIQLTPRQIDNLLLNRS